MKRDDIINILCRLKYCCDDFEMVQTSLVYEFSGRNYEIKFERDKGRVISFQVNEILDANK